MLFQRIRDLTVPSADDGRAFVEFARLDRIAALLQNSCYRSLANRPLARIYSHQNCNPDEPYILISCHIDSLYERYFAEKGDGVFIGTFDNSACNALLVEAMLADALPPQALIAFTGDEEEDSKGADQTVETLDQDGFLSRLQMVMVLDLTEEGYKKCSFTLENLFVRKMGEGLRFECKKELKKYLKKIVGPAVFLINAEADESWQYHENRLNCFSLCLPCKARANDMHDDRGVKIREDAIITYLQVLSQLANGICQNLIEDQSPNR